MPKKRETPAQEYERTRRWLEASEDSAQTPDRILELAAACAVDGARDRLAANLDFDTEPIIVATVAWKDKDGNPFVIASAIPDGHGHELLAESLRQSAEEATDV